MSNTKLTFDSLPQAVETLNNNVELLLELMNKMNDRITAIENALHSSDTTLDAEEAAQLIKRTKGTLYKMVCNNELPFHKKGNRLTFQKNELLAWLTSESNSQAPCEPESTIVVNKPRNRKFGTLS